MINLDGNSCGDSQIYVWESLYRSGRVLVDCERSPRSAIVLVMFIRIVVLWGSAMTFYSYDNTSPVGLEWGQCDGA